MSAPRGLHLGCFDQPLRSDDWLNTDVTPHLFLARLPGAAEVMRALRVLPEERYQQQREGLFRRVHYLDVRRRFPYSDATFEYVFCSHLLEHLTREGAVRCAEEVHRVLRDGGVFRVSVPDLDLAVRGYDAASPEPFLEAMYEPSHGGRRNRHHWMYNAFSLGQLLARAGFARSERCEFRRGRCLDVERLDNRPDSLFMEAFK